MKTEIPLITKVISVTPDDTVEHALSVLEKKNIRYAPVLDKEGGLLGMFSLHHLLTNLLPVSVNIEGGLQNIDFVIGAAPGMAKRLAGLMTRKVEDVMDRKPHTLKESTPGMEVIRLLVRHGSPLAVVEEESGKLIGLVSEQNAINWLAGSAAQKA